MVNVIVGVRVQLVWLKYVESVCENNDQHFRSNIFDREDDPNYNPLPEERPGGFDWGEGQVAGEQPHQD